MLRKFLAVLLLIPLPVLADHVPTQEPYGYNETVNTETGDLTISLLGSDGFEDSPPEKYTIFFAMATGVDASSYCVSTSFGHEQNVWNDYVFSISDLRTYFELPVGTFYYRVRSDNDTDNSYSTISAERSIALPDQTPFNETQTDWSAPTTTCVDTSTTTTTTSSTTTVPDTTTTSSTTTTTTTTTVPPPPPPPPEPEKVEVVMDDGSTAEYETYEVEDGTVDRDNQRKANEEKYGCYMTDAQIERGDCKLPEEEPKEEVIIVVDEERDTKEELPDDDVVVLELELEDEVKEPEPIKEEDIVEEEVKIDVKELEEEFKFEEEPIIFEDIPEDIVIVIEEEIVEEVEEVAEEVLVEPIQEDVKEEPTEVVEVLEEVIVEELTEEEVAVEVAEVEEVIEDIVIEEVTTEEVIEVIEQVNDIGVQNLDQATEEVQEVVQAVVEEAIENVEDLSEEQVAVVAEVLQVQEDDVEIIAEAVKEDEAVAEAVEEYVERAVENADVENYTLADVVTEVQFEQFIENPIEVLVDFDDIDLSEIGNDMTQDQKEKAQEVVVPVILTRIATMASFIFRRNL